MAVVKVKAPFADAVKSLPPLLRSTKLAPDARPETMPPVVKLVGAWVTQAIATLLTLALAVPEPLVTVQVWLAGWSGS